ncbi:MAG: plastocyanin/azurin family copper-binding protein [Natrialbaceae archaeon]|nr:plastocyanin/azurin family copper-binding protein [Natrialbaceae archaeon]
MYSTAWSRAGKGSNRVRSRDRSTPPLELEAGQTYEVTWENVDGEPHNFAILSGAGEQLRPGARYIEEQGATQTVEFEATGDMAEYYCEVHPDTMRGEISVTGNGDGATGPPLEGVQVAGEFEPGATVGLQRVAEGLPGVTALVPADPGDGMRHYLADPDRPNISYDPSTDEDSMDQRARTVPKAVTTTLGMDNETGRRQ